jgi:hypothetical protein
MSTFDYILALLKRALIDEKLFVFSFFMMTDIFKNITIYHLNINCTILNKLIRFFCQKQVYYEIKSLKVLRMLEISFRGEPDDLKIDQDYVNIFIQQCTCDKHNLCCITVC